MFKPLNLKIRNPIFTSPRELIALLSVTVMVISIFLTSYMAQTRQIYNSRAQTTKKTYQLVTQIAEGTCQYPIRVVINPNDSSIFTFTAQSEIINQSRLDGIIAGSLQDFLEGDIANLTIIPGPLNWTSGGDNNWTYVHDYSYNPEVIAIGAAAWVGNSNEIRYGCSFWQKETTLEDACPPSLNIPADGDVISSSNSLLAWNICDIPRPEGRHQLNIEGGTNHPLNTTITSELVTNYDLDSAEFTLDPGARYYWRVRGCNDENCDDTSPWSYPRSFWWESLTTPDPITACEYSITITQNDQDNHLFVFSAPPDIITPVKIDGILAGSLVDFEQGNTGNLTVIPGPLDWAPEFDGGWAHTELFDTAPEVVAIGLGAWVGDVQEIRYGCGNWRIHRKVFASSQTYNGNLGGLAGSDAKCQTLANNAGLPGTYKAWLSTSLINAKDRINDAEFALTDGTIIAYSKADLTDTSIQNKLNKDEYNNTLAGALAWTGTNPDGTKATNFCSNWVNASSTLHGDIGDGNYLDGKWTLRDITQDTCNTLKRLYCFQTSTVTPSPTPTPIPTATSTPTPRPTPTPLPTPTPRPKFCNCDQGVVTYNNCNPGYTPVCTTQYTCSCGKTITPTPTKSPL